MPNTLTPTQIRRFKRAIAARAKALPEQNVRRTLRQAIALARDLAREFRSVRETLPAERLEAAIRANNLQLIERIIDWAVMGERLQDAAKPSMRQSYKRGAEVTNGKLTRAGINIRFSVMDPRAEEWAQRASSDLIVQITDEQRRNVREIIAEAHRDGVSPQDTAARIRQNVGLTERQMNAVARYGQRLVDQELPSDKISRLLDKYSDALLRQRSETIARTELLRAANEGQLQTVREGIKQNKIEVRRTFRQWIVTDDDRLDTEICLPMSEPEAGEVRIDQPWVLPDGREVFNPTDSHPNCRCSWNLEIKHLDEDEE